MRASGGIIIVWDTRFATKVEAIFGSFSVSVLLEVKGRGTWWFSSVYGPPRPRGRDAFLEELGSLGGFCSLNWIVCVCGGGGFHCPKVPL